MLGRFDQKHKGAKRTSQKTSRRSRGGDSRLSLTSREMTLDLTEEFIDTTIDELGLPGLRQRASNTQNPKDALSRISLTRNNNAVRTSRTTNVGSARTSKHSIDQLRKIRESNCQKKKISLIEDKAIKEERLLEELCESYGIEASKIDSKNKIK